MFQFHYNCEEHRKYFYDFQKLSDAKFVPLPSTSNMPYTVKKTGISGDLADRGQMKLLERHVLQTVGDMTDRIAGGQVGPDPMVRGPYSPCRYCDYQTVCHKDLGTQTPRNLAETSAKKFWEILQREEKDRG